MIFTTVMDHNGLDNKAFEKGYENGMEKTPSILTLQSNETFDTSPRFKLTKDSFPEKNGKINYPSKKEESYDPFSNRDKSHATSSMGAFVHMVKSSLGTGILAMPGAFKNGGLIFGVIGTLITGLICTHCVHMMVQCSQILSSRVKRPTLSFAETAEVSFQTGPPRYRFLASFAREIINFTLFCTYFFGNTVYIIFIARTFEQVIEGHAHFGWDVRVYIILLAFVLVPLGIIRTLKYLVPFSAIATAFISFGLALTLYYTFSEMPSDVSNRDFIGTPLKIPLFFSTVLFAMEGIGTVLPIENSMSKPEQFLGCPGVLNGAMSIVVILYMVVGFFGYLRFGNATQATVTLNLPDSTLAESVKVLVALSVLLTYGLQFTVPSEIVWKRLGPRVSEDKQDMGYYIMRGSMIIGTVIVAIMLPSLAPIISLVGAICFSILGLFCPAVIEIITLWEEGYGKYQWRFYKNVFLIFLSIFSLVSGSYASILEILDAIKHGEL